MDRFPAYRQLDQMDCGPTCLRMIARYHGRNVSADKLRERCSLSNQGGTVSSQGALRWIR